MWLPIRLILTLISTYLTTSIIRNQRKVIKLLILISLRAISQMTWSYTNPLRPCTPIFKILTELKLRILIGLVIGSLIITTIGVHIRVYTRSLIRGFISRKYSYSLYYRAAYPKQQLRPPYNQVSVISIILQLITIGRSKRALAPPLLRINVNREVGIGKLYFITILSTTLYNIAISNSKPSLLVRANPTKVATFNINSRTIYELLRLLVNRPFKELPTASLTPL